MQGPFQGSSPKEIEWISSSLLDLLVQTCTQNKSRNVTHCSQCEDISAVTLPRALPLIGAEPSARAARTAHWPCHGPALTWPEQPSHGPLVMPGATTLPWGLQGNSAQLTGSAATAGCCTATLTSYRVEPNPGGGPGHRRGAPSVFTSYAWFLQALPIPVGLPDVSTMSWKLSS